jgi:hypothetical protein
VYRNPIERAAEMRSLYEHGAPARDRLSVLHATQLPVARAQARRVRRILGRGGAGIEVGSYSGAFLVAAKEAGLDIEGVDVNRDVNAFARQLGARVHDGELRDQPCRHPLDVVAIWNTFDQLADPRGTVMAAVQRLNPSGAFVVRVPNGACYAAWRRRLDSGTRPARAVARAILAQNNLLTFPYRWGFTVASITRLLGEAGLVVERVHGDVLVPIGDEWTRAWARVEERLTKAALRRLVARSPERAPWIELYARKSRPI